MKWLFSIYHISRAWMSILTGNSQWYIRQNQHYLHSQNKSNHHLRKAKHAPMHVVANSIHHISIVYWEQIGYACWVHHAFITCLHYNTFNAPCKREMKLYSTSPDTVLTYSFTDWSWSWFDIFQFQFPIYKCIVRQPEWRNALQYSGKLTIQITLHACIFFMTS